MKFDTFREASEAERRATVFFNTFHDVYRVSIEVYWPLKFHVSKCWHNGPTYLTTWPNKLD